MRLIDADEVQKRIDMMGTVNGILCCDAHEFIDHVPTIEAEPVRHGYWEESPTGNKNFNYCSVCGGAIQKYDNETFAYCPHCGAKMDGGDAS